MALHASRLVICALFAFSAILAGILGVYLNDVSAPIAAALGAAVTVTFCLPLSLRWQVICLAKTHDLAQTIAAVSTSTYVRELKDLDLRHTQEIERLSTAAGKLTVQFEETQAKLHDAEATLSKVRLLQRDAKGRIVSLSAVPSTPVVIHDTE